MNDDTKMSKTAQVVLGVFMLGLAVGPAALAINHMQDENKTLKAVRMKDPSVMENCTVSKVNAPDAHPSRGGTDYTVNVETEQCGVVVLDETLTLPDGEHMEIYRNLIIGQTYEFGLNEDRIIYSVTDIDGVESQDTSEEDLESKGN